jgi:hypothetical protein
VTTAVDIQINGLSSVLVRMDRVIRGTAGEVDRVTQVNAHRLIVFIQQHIRAQGLIETGAYLSSWSVLKIGRTSYGVTTDAPQSDRLEYGFTGVDSLGRSYRQTPRAHRRPAAEQSRAAYMDDLRKVVPILWGR